MGLFVVLPPTPTLPGTHIVFLFVCFFCFGVSKHPTGSSNRSTAVELDPLSSEAMCIKHNIKGEKEEESTVFYSPTTKPEAFLGGAF
jgi:hypothetical protein